MTDRDDRRLPESDDTRASDEEPATGDETAADDETATGGTANERLVWRLLTDV